MYGYGSVISQARRHRGLSQNQLGRMAGISQVYVAHVELEAHGKVPSEELCEQLATTLALSDKDRTQLFSAARQAREDKAAIRKERSAERIRRSVVEETVEDADEDLDEFEAVKGGARSSAQPHVTDSKTEEERLLTRIRKALLDPKRRAIVLPVVETLLNSLDNERD